MPLDNDDSKISAALVIVAVERIQADIKEMEQRLNDYVLQLVFDSHRQYVDQRLKPLEKLVYGLVGLVLVGVVTAVMTLVIK